MKVIIYKSVTKIFYAVTTRKVGNWPVGHQIINLHGFSLAETLNKLCDWCANNNVPKNSVCIKLGYLPGKVTNYHVYNFNHDWISDTQWLKEHGLI